MTGFRRLFKTTFGSTSGVAASLGLAGLLSASLLGCGGGGNGGNVVLPPGGIPAGVLICRTTFLPNVNELVQGGTMTITFRVVDANLFTSAPDLPVSFEVFGGALPGPPDRTDADGYVTVTFVADTTYFGVARIALIQPDRHLRCDVSLLILQPTCTLTSRVLTGAGVVVPGYGFDACGKTEDNLQRQVARRVTYHVTRVNPVTNLVDPMAGAMIRLNATGLNFGEMIIGPTNANGDIEAGDTDGDGVVDTPITPFASGVGTASLTATVIIPDANADGHPDHFPCNTCTNSWGIIDPICDNNGGALVMAVFDANHNPAAGDLHPGWTVEASATFMLAGVPQSGFPVLARCSNGTINGSGLPQHLITTPGGFITVTYAPNVGFAGTDTIVIEANDNFETCSFSSTVNVETCAMTVTADSAAVSMNWATTEAMTLHLDPGPNTPVLIGQSVSVTVTGGYLTTQLPTRLVEDDGFGNPVVRVSFTASLGFAGNAGFTVNFPGGYPCLATQATFPVTRP